MFVLNPNSKSKIFEQIRDQFIDYIFAGFFVSNQQLPTVRVLAKELGINPNTVQKAYNELESLGYIYSVQSVGSFVSDVKKLSVVTKQEKLTQLRQLISSSLKVGITKEEVIEIVKEIKEESYD